MRILLVPTEPTPAEFLSTDLPHIQAIVYQDKAGSLLTPTEDHLPSEMQGTHLKSAFRFAIDQSFDYVIQINGFAGKSSEWIRDLLQPCLENPAIDCILGTNQNLSLGQRALNRLVSTFQKVLTGEPLQHWRPDVRVYRTAALTRIAFELNTEEAHFETEVLQQLLYVHARVLERTYAGSRNAGAQWHWGDAWNTCKAGVKYRLQKVNLFYDFRYHPELVLSSAGTWEAHADYTQKFESDSPHSFVVRNTRLIRRGSRVLDLGCSRGYVADYLVSERGCQVTGVDLLPEEQMKGKRFDYHQIDLEKDMPKLLKLIESQSYDYILLLDVLEHLPCPELFLLQLHRQKTLQNTLFVISTGNVAFVVIRLMLFLGYFNYGQKGILDITHKRLFSVRTFKNLLDQTGFLRHERVCFPLPYRELGFSDGLARGFEKVHRALLRLRPSLFAYQVLYIARSSDRHPHNSPTTHTSGHAERRKTVDPVLASH